MSWELSVLKFHIFKITGGSMLFFSKHNTCINNTHTLKMIKFIINVCYLTNLLIKMPTSGYFKIVELLCKKSLFKFTNKNNIIFGL